MPIRCPPTGCSQQDIVFAVGPLGAVIAAGGRVLLTRALLAAGTLVAGKAASDCTSVGTFKVLEPLQNDASSNNPDATTNPKPDGGSTDVYIPPADASHPAPDSGSRDGGISDGGSDGGTPVVPVDPPGVSILARNFSCVKPADIDLFTRDNINFVRVVCGNPPSVTDVALPSDLSQESANVSSPHVIAARSDNKTFEIRFHEMVSGGFAVYAYEVAQRRITRDDVYDDPGVYGENAMGFFQVNAEGIGIHRTFDRGFSFIFSDDWEISVFPKTPGGLVERNYTEEREDPVPEICISGIRITVDPREKMAMAICVPRDGVAGAVDWRQPFAMASWGSEGTNGPSGALIPHPTEEDATGNEQAYFINLGSDTGDSSLVDLLSWQTMDIAREDAAYPVILGGQVAAHLIWTPEPLVDNNRMYVIEDGDELRLIGFDMLASTENRVRATRFAEASGPNEVSPFFSGAAVYENKLYIADQGKLFIFAIHDGEENWLEKVQVISKIGASLGPIVVLPLLEGARIVMSRGGPFGAPGNPQLIVIDPSVAPNDLLSDSP